MELFIFALIGAIVVGVVANARGRPGAWFLLGLLCWPLALILVLCLPNLKERARHAAQLEEQRRQHEQLLAVLASTGRDR